MRGRGTPSNPSNRFESLKYERLLEDEPEEPLAPKTVFLRDPSRTILSRNNSPDIGFNFSINPYRGCEHGCVYCYARPTHEYLGFSAGLDFETKIIVKDQAPRLLRKALAAPSYQPSAIAISGVTDCYQPVERRLEITRGCLEVLAEFRNPVWIITKNALVTRDIDVLKRLAEVKACAVMISLTTLDSDLCGIMEPRTSRPAARLEAIEKLAAAGIPVGVNLAPIIPTLNEVEIPALLRAARGAGAQFSGYTTVRLPFGVKELFSNWLEEHFPERKKKVLSHIREMRGGKLNDPRFETRMHGEGHYAQRIEMLFTVSARRAQMDGPGPQLSTRAFCRHPQPGEQLELL